ncbi:ABC transporter permease [Brevibacillus sp. 179-C 1.1 NHS]|uniref:ABC transporter permease n=1 Tax=Brevibacillus sp. 179-C 1.1 NHS TaxID=3235177 RepID=UPI0039A36009
MRILLLEFYKIRHKHLFLMIAILLGVELAWGFMAVSSSMTKNPNAASWSAILVTISAMNGLFLPIGSAVIVSRIGDMEHKGRTWKLLMAASVSRKSIYAAKFICAAVLMVFAILLQAVAIVVFGIGYGLTEPVPITLMTRFVAGAMLTNLVVIALQQWVSLAIKNQAFSLSLGMIGGFIGMTASLFPPQVGRLFIWSYYVDFSPVTYQFVNETILFTTREIGAHVPIIVLLMGIAFYLAGSIHVSRLDV